MLLQVHRHISYVLIEISNDFLLIGVKVFGSLSSDEMIQDWLYSQHACCTVVYAFYYFYTCIYNIIFYALLCVSVIGSSRSTLQFNPHIPFLNWSAFHILHLTVFYWLCCLLSY